MPGHKITRSKKCPKHKESKAEEIKDFLGDSTSITRKIKFNTIVRDEYADDLEKIIISTSNHIRNILIRCQIFVNYYIIVNSNSAIDKRIFTQNFWYSICKLVLNQEVTNLKSLPDNIMTYWTSFKNIFGTIVYDVKMENGYSNCMTVACNKMSTVYTNMIVENFESRLTNYFLWSIQKEFPEMSRKNAQLISNSFCYPFVCGMNPEWPKDIDDSKRIEIYNAISEYIPSTPVNTVKTFANPGRYIPVLSKLLEIYEKEHDSTLSQKKPVLFSLAPSPSMKWRYITINSNCLAAFTEQKLPKNYSDVLI
ncbi:hypothetical protein EDC94DRAFT_565497 [Helicostylum pulchrum]|nr:hypothetical protein EDC94DRAFT_565497 [Helicostylum pulchrum]